jgi:hypothetical protein
MVNLPKVLHTVTPAQAGVQDLMGALDSGLRRNDRRARSSNFCESPVITIVFFLEGFKPENVEETASARYEKEA